MPKRLSVVREDVDDVDVEDVDEDVKYTAKQDSSQKGLMRASFDRTNDKTPENVISVKTTATKEINY